MNRHWKLRDELYNVFHRWPALLAAILTGCLLGWGLSFIWPSHYRATSQIYIALNPYRTYSDTLFEALINPKFSNLDNYHYWQMSQLEAAIYLDRFLEPVLKKLRAQDPYWDSVELEQLRVMLDSEWRSTGNWNLIANHPRAAQAGQAASAWSDVVVETVREAVESAQKTFRIDQQLQAGEADLLRARQRIQELKGLRSTLEVWSSDLALLEPQEPLPQDQRWQLLAIVAGAADFSPSWMAVLESQPPLDADRQAYQNWIQQITPVIQTELTTLDEQIRQIEEQQIELSRQYSIESRNSLGFSPNIEVERKEDLGTRAVRPSAVFILIGGMIGILIWLLIQLVIISNSRRNH